MSEVKITKKPYRGWNNCIYINNDIVELIITTDIGPRIISYSFVGGKNQFCEIENQVGTTNSEKFNLYGGHRLWHSPEDLTRTYVPDNTEIKWEEIENGVKLTQNTEKWTQIQKSVEIILSENDTTVTINHSLKNEGAWPIEASVWAITVMKTGGIEILPQSSSETGLLPNRTLSLWPYTKLSDPRLTLGDKYILLKQRTDLDHACKFGYPNYDGWAAYINENTMFIKKHVHFLQENYPDFNSSYETYTCDFMLEMETLSPLYKIGPNETVDHIELWNLYNDIDVPKSEDEITELMKKIL